MIYLLSNKNMSETHLGESLIYDSPGTDQIPEFSEIVTECGNGDLEHHVSKDSISGLNCLEMNVQDTVGCGQSDRFASSAKKQVSEITCTPYPAYGDHQYTISGNTDSLIVADVEYVLKNMLNHVSLPLSTKSNICTENHNDRSLPDLNLVGERIASAEVASVIDEVLHAVCKGDACGIIGTCKSDSTNSLYISKNYSSTKCKLNNDTCDKCTTNRLLTTSTDESDVKRLCTQLSISSPKSRSKRKSFPLKCHNVDSKRLFLSKKSRIIIENSVARNTLGSGSTLVEVSKSLDMEDHLKTAGICFVNMENHGSRLNSVADIPACNNGCVSAAFRKEPLLAQSSDKQLSKLEHEPRSNSSIHIETTATSPSVELDNCLPLKSNCPWDSQISKLPRQCPDKLELFTTIMTETCSAVTHPGNHINRDTNKNSSSNPGDVQNSDIDLVTHGYACRSSLVESNLDCMSKSSVSDQPATSISDRAGGVLKDSVFVINHNRGTVTNCNSPTNNKDTSITCQVINQCSPCDNPLISTSPSSNFSKLDKQQDPNNLVPPVKRYSLRKKPFTWYSYQTAFRRGRFQVGSKLTTKSKTKTPFVNTTDEATETEEVTSHCTNHISSEGDNENGCPSTVISPASQLPTELKSNCNSNDSKKICKKYNESLSTRRILPRKRIPKRHRNSARTVSLQNASAQKFHISDLETLKACLPEALVSVKKLQVPVNVESEERKNIDIQSPGTGATITSSVLNHERSKTSSRRVTARLSLKKVSRKRIVLNSKKSLHCSGNGGKAMANNVLSQCKEASKKSRNLDTSLPGKKAKKKSFESKTDNVLSQSKAASHKSCNSDMNLPRDCKKAKKKSSESKMEDDSNLRNSVDHEHQSSLPNYRYVPKLCDIQASIEPGVAVCCFCHLPGNHVLGIGDLYGPYRPRAEEVLSRQASFNEHLKVPGVLDNVEAPYAADGSPTVSAHLRYRYYI